MSFFTQKINSHVECIGGEESSGGRGELKGGLGRIESHHVVRAHFRLRYLTERSEQHFKLHLSWEALVLLVFARPVNLILRNSLHIRAELLNTQHMKYFG